MMISHLEYAAFKRLAKNVVKKYEKEFRTSDRDRETWTIRMNWTRRWLFREILYFQAIERDAKDNRFVNYEEITHKHT